MGFLGDFGIFLAGVGILLLGCGLMWYISEWTKLNKPQ